MLRPGTSGGANDSVTENYGAGDEDRTSLGWLNGTTLINPGSAGMPLDGDARAAYALRRDDGEFEFRRVEYDVERAARAWEQQPGWGKMAAQRIRNGSD